MLSASYTHTLLLHADGTVWAWGMNSTGSLGDGTFTERIAPERGEGLTDVVAVAAGNDHSLALRRDGTVWGWGASDWARLGTKNLGPVLRPMRLPLPCRFNAMPSLEHGGGQSCHAAP